MFARVTAVCAFALSIGACATAGDAPRANYASIEAGQAWAKACEDWDDWNKPAPPFRIHGNTWHVGTCGISAILVLGESHHALIDTGTDDGADVVLANIRTLGVNPEDIGVLAASHEHHDHVGGMAKVQAATGADVIGSDVLIDVLINNRPNPEDPQAAIYEPMQPITHGMPFYYANAPELLDHVGLNAISTPGHTPGALSWQWQSCDDAGDCLTVVYADSLSPVSSDDYRFLDHPEYLQLYRDGIDRIAALDCDILITPHPSASGMRDKMLAGDMRSGPRCMDYAAGITARLNARLAEEAEGNP